MLHRGAWLPYKEVLGTTQLEFITSEIQSLNIVFLDIELAASKVQR